MFERSPSIHAAIFSFGVCPQAVHERGDGVGADEVKVGRDIHVREGGPDCSVLAEEDLGVVWIVVGVDAQDFPLLPIEVGEDAGLQGRDRGVHVVAVSFAQLCDNTGGERVERVVFRA